MNDQTAAPLTHEREQEIRDSIPTVYGPPWTIHPDMEDGTWRVLYATDHPLAGLVCEVPDYGAHLAEFIATARAAVPELLDELDRLRTDAAAVLLPDWEAVYEPGNVSDYLIGYANDEAAAKGAAEAWMRSQAEVTGRLEWTVMQLADDDPQYDRWFDLVERHDDGVDTGPGITVRRRVARPAEQPEFTDAGTAYFQIGMTPALQGLRAELRIEGRAPLVGRYAGAGMRRAKNHDDLMIIEPMLLFPHGAAPAPEEQPAEACGKCKTPFDPADTRFDGHSQYNATPYCRRCVDACHDTEIADHRCVICA